MEIYGRFEVRLHEFSTSALDGVNGQLHAPMLYPWETDPNSHLIGAWVSRRCGLDAVE
jgi:hypothetical protein